MAVKKTVSSKPETSASTKKKAKAVKKKAAPKKKKAAPKKATAAMTAASKKAPVKKAAPKKVAAPAKLTAPQTDLLKKIMGAGDMGYLAQKKAEVRTIEALMGRKLVKRGTKKEKGIYHYTVSKTGAKHLGA